MFDELGIGEESLSPGRTINEADVVTFCSLCGFHNPLFLDEELARKSGFGGRLIPGPLTVSYSIGLGDHLFGRTGGAVLSWNNVKFPKPLRIGDTIRLKTIIADKRDSCSQPDKVIVNLKHEVLNQHGETVCSFERTLMILKQC